MTIEVVSEGPDSFEFTPDLGPAGGYAFPHKPSRTESVGMGMFVCHPGDQPGMRLLDWFAGQAMQALLAEPDCDLDEIGDNAYFIATKMLKARSA